MSYITFTQAYPELFRPPVINPIVETTWDLLRNDLFLETMNFEPYICIPYELSNSLTITKANVSELALDLYLAHILVSSNPEYSALLPDVTKKVKSLDNEIEFQAFKGFNSKYDLNMTIYGQRLLNLLDRYSCKSQAQNYREGLHEISGIAAEQQSDCSDDDSLAGTLTYIW